jgi:glycosyltransferase involved in cell wall biosynthesis
MSTESNYETSLVSIVIIFLNAEKYMIEAIESVLAQTYQHWELLLVDDGSSDASTIIARDYAMRMPSRIRYLEHPNHGNLGMGATRNVGIKNSRGKYVAFLDADDVYLPNKIAEQVAILESQPEADVLYGNTKYWHGWTQQPADIERDYVPILGVPDRTLFRPPTLLPLLLRGKAAAPCSCSIVAKRDLLLDIDGFEEGFVVVGNIYEDQAFYAKACLHGAILAVDQCWDLYRQHPESSMATATKAGQEIAARRFYLLWLRDYLDHHGINDSGVRAALNKELWLIQHYRYPQSSLFARKSNQVTRWLKKWLLRVEEWVTPRQLDEWWWKRESSATQ